MTPRTEADVEKKEWARLVARGHFLITSTEGVLRCRCQWTWDDTGPLGVEAFAEHRVDMFVAAVEW